MKSFANFKKMKETDERISYSFKRHRDSYSENRLSPITITGLIVPRETISNKSGQPEYKLTFGNGVEYVLLSGPEVCDVLPLYCWKEVKIVGLLNKSNMTVIPQKIFSKGSEGQSTNVIHLSLWKNQNLKRKVLNKINELIVVPTAVFAVLAS